MEFVILACCQHTELSFRSDADGGERETSFAQGRWFVGQTLVKMLNLGPQFIAELRKQENAGPKSPTRLADKLARSGS
jgi:hypothetical protein